VNEYVKKLIYSQGTKVERKHFPNLEFRELGVTHLSDLNEGDKFYKIMIYFRDPDILFEKWNDWVNKNIKPRIIENLVKEVEFWNVKRENTFEEQLEALTKLAEKHRVEFKYKFVDD